MYRLLNILFFLLLFFSLNAQIGGTYTYSFLEITNSARLAALGGKNISIPTTDLNLVYDNPAMLDTGMSQQLVLNYLNYFAGINYGYVAYANKFEKAGMFAAGLNYINYGKFIKADETGKITGEFSAFELAMNIFWSKVLIDSTFSVGINLKPIYSQMETYSSFGLALDAGLQYRNKKGLSAGLVIRNFGTQLKPYTQGNYEKIPLNIQLGISQKLAHAPFRFSVLYNYINQWDLSYNKADNIAYSAVAPTKTELEAFKISTVDNFFRHFIYGLEFVPSRNFNLLFGYNHQRRKELMIVEKPGLVGFSWGFYINIKKIKISFGQAFYHLAGASNHFSVNYNLGSTYQKK
ncbi:MAG: type IX secretion system protein PorQ [Bacteroidales bacterium]|nr:type IX secretion system protein PorQ [Bacteroidales bacterium]